MSADARHPLGRSTAFRSKLALLSRYRPEDVDGAALLRRDHFAAKLAEDIVVRLAEGPELTAEQRATLARLFEAEA